MDGSQNHVTLTGIRLEKTERIARGSSSPTRTVKPRKKKKKKKIKETLFCSVR